MANLLVLLNVLQNNLLSFGEEAGCHIGLCISAMSC